MTVVITRNIEMDVLEIQKSEIKCTISLDTKDLIEELVERGRGLIPYSGYPIGCSAPHMLRSATSISGTLESHLQGLTTRKIANSAPGTGL